jgi:hypothetical protein
MFTHLRPVVKVGAALISRKQVKVALGRYKLHSLSNLSLLIFKDKSFSQISAEANLSLCCGRKIFAFLT